jgi:HD-like signal output (HDOD) protein
MTTGTTTASDSILPLTREQIERRLQQCARLPSLSTINSALRELLNADQRYTSQVAEIIRRDPSLTARLLRLVNSVYYGLSSPVNSIEEAVFYLGVRQIRQLVMVTPVIEDFTRLAGQTAFPWREFWQHCIGTAILAREVLSAQQAPADEVDYVSGLVHDVGKIAMAAAFPHHFDIIHRQRDQTTQDLLSLETEVLGIDHAELGALYLQSHHLPDVLVEVARFHHQPERAGHHAPMVAAVHLADLLVRHARIGNSGNHAPVSDEDWLNDSAWEILFPQKFEAEKMIARASVQRSLERLPTILEGLV